MTRLTDSAGLLLLRLALGAVFIAHGAQKLFGSFGGDGIDGTQEMFDGLGIPLADVMAPFVAVVEFGGGILLVLGLATPLVALALIGDMVVAVITVHGENGFFSADNGFEFNLMLAAASATLLFAGAGRFSADAAISWRDRLGSRRSPEPTVAGRPSASASS